MKNMLSFLLNKKKKQIKSLNEKPLPLDFASVGPKPTNQDPNRASLRGSPFKKGFN